MSVAGSAGLARYIFDDRESERELLDDGYRSPIPERLRWCKWARDQGLSGHALIDFINKDLFKALKELPVSGKDMALAGVVRGIFEDAYNYMKSGVRMRQVLNTLDQIDFNRAADRHQLGDIYEQLLANLPDAANSGEYYTPRAVTKFIVDRVDPKLGENVLDPACGTGDFLTHVIEHVREKYVNSNSATALRVKVVRNTCSGATPSTSKRLSTSHTSVCVLPVPGPAMIHNGQAPWSWRRARSCSSFKGRRPSCAAFIPSRNRSMSMVRSPPLLPAANGRR
jgi:hypothetical protein